METREPRAERLCQDRSMDGNRQASRGEHAPSVAASQGRASSLIIRSSYSSIGEGEPERNVCSNASGRKPSSRRRTRDGSGSPPAAYQLKRTLARLGLTNDRFVVLMLANLSDVRVGPVSRSRLTEVATNIGDGWHLFPVRRSSGEPSVQRVTTDQPEEQSQRREDCVENTCHQDHGYDSANRVSERQQRRVQRPDCLGACEPNRAHQCRGTGQNQGPARTADGPSPARQPPHPIRPVSAQRTGAGYSQ